MNRDAKNVLQNFIKEMKEWELKWGHLFESQPTQIFSENVMEMRLNELVVIQNKYLSKKALSLQQDRRTTLTFGIPPEYEQKISKENSLNDEKIEIHTKNADNEDCRVYVLVLEDSQWKIDLMKIKDLNWKLSRQVF